MGETAKTRRRGVELEAAILQAAWDQLVSDGYGRFTFDTVAERAETSKSVLYRRWDGREALLRAAVRHRGSTMTDRVPDTGSVREDLFLSMRNGHRRSNTMAALFSALVSSHFEDIGMTPTELRAELIGSRETSVEQILARAVERGEVDESKLTPRIVDLPFALYRQEYLMTFAPPSDAVLGEILDQIVLPLILRDAD